MFGFVENFLNEFKDFAVNSKSLDIAVGMLLGTAIKPVANSMVDDFVMPLMGFIGKDEDLKNKYFLLREGKSGQINYKTVDEAKKDGAIVISYGNFISAVLNFVVLSGSAYAFIKITNNLKNKRINIPTFREVIPINGLGQYQQISYVI
jgi:large conductance mechanosensitive channel